MGRFDAVRRRGIYRVGDWQAGWLRAPEDACGRLGEALVAALRRSGAPAGWFGDPEDLAGDKMAEWLEEDPPVPLRWPPRAPFAPYIGRIAMNIARDAARHRGRLPETAGIPQAAMEDAAAPGALGLAELRMDLESLQERLPRPYRQILGWLIAGGTGRQIAVRLREWAAVGPDRSRSLVRETRAIVADCLRGDGGLLRDLLRREKKKKKSRWESTPPPP